MSRAWTLWRVLGAEGPPSAANRALDRLAEARRRRAFAPARAAYRLPAPAPVLNLVGQPPVPWLGGAALQLRERLAAEAAARPVALLFPERGWRLELAAGDERRAMHWNGRAPEAPDLEDARLADLVRRAADVAGAGALHVEGLAGLPLASLLALRRSGLELVVSLHDFAAFCPRPHLVERPDERFCDYSRDARRCAVCLAQDWSLPAGFQEERRGVAASLLGEAAAVVYPSEFLRGAHRALFPDLDSLRQRVLAPALALEPGPARRPAWPPRHVAYAGSVKPHKGAAVFAELASGWGTRSPELRWSAYGGGDPGLLSRLRRAGVRARGYHRPGSLARLLARDRVDLAILPSIVPEAFGLTLAECWAAGVPCVVFDLGAPAERLRRQGGGWVVPAAAGAAGLADLLRRLVAGEERPPEVPRAPAGAVGAAARGMLELYRELGFTGAGPPPA